MTKISTVKYLAVSLVFIASGSLAQAQATRTWVSGVGDDANPCSRTAPCKTFAGAISKTAANGEINVLDPGGFGAVTITKSITILAEGSVAGVLVNGTNGINVITAATDKVVLRGLDFEGLGTGLNGVRFTGGGTLVVDRCRINGFSDANSGNGVDFEPTIDGAHLVVNDTMITNCSGTGIEVKPASGSGATATVERTQLLHDGPGLRAENGAKVTVRRTVASENVYAAFSTRSSAEMNVIDCVATNNRWGVRADTSTIRFGGTTVSGNTESGLSIVGSANLLSFGTNQVAGNAVDGSATGQVPQQ